MYDGSRAGWKEDDACEPVNAYGASKLEAERYLQASILLLSCMINLLSRGSLHVFTVCWPVAQRTFVGLYTE